MVTANSNALSTIPALTVASQSHAGFDVEVVADPAGMLGLRSDWDRVASGLALPNIYSTFEWYWGWWTLIAPRQPHRAWRLNVLVVRRAGEITGIVPLATRSAGRAGLTIRKLEFIGADDLPDYQQPLFAGAPEAQARAVAAHLASTRNDWDILELHNLKPDAAEVLSKAMRHAFAVRTVGGQECPFLHVEGPWSIVEQRASKLTRQTLRNQGSRLRREGIRVRIVERPDTEPCLLDRMIEVESRKRVRGAPGDLLLARWPEFFGWLFQELGAKGRLAVAVMEKQDRLLAYNLFFLCGQSIWDYAKAYDPACAKLSPGTMLFAAMVDYAHLRGYTEYDFLRGAEPYKLKWATGVRSTRHLQAWHKNWRSQASALLYFQLHRQAYQVLARLRGR